MRTESTLIKNTFEDIIFDKDAVKESNKVALSMGVFSIGLMLVIGAIAQLLH
jgi:hypothetical protein